MTIGKVFRNADNVNTGVTVAAEPKELEKR